MVKKLKHVNVELSPGDKQKLEKGFLLDGVAVATMCSDGVMHNPKVSSAVPQYHSQNDKLMRAFFSKPAVKDLLQKTAQTNVCKFTRNMKEGEMGRYIKSRNKTGAGYSQQEMGGHQTYMSSCKAFNGYNGAGGYRRNTPELRSRPSPFSVQGTPKKTKK